MSSRRHSGSRLRGSGPGRHFGAAGREEEEKEEGERRKKKNSRRKNAGGGEAREPAGGRGEDAGRHYRSPGSPSAPSRRNKNLKKTK